MFDSLTGWLDLLLTVTAETFVSMSRDRDQHNVEQAALITQRYRHSDLGYSVVLLFRAVATGVYLDIYPQNQSTLIFMFCLLAMTS